MERTPVYAGSFDPITKGHLSVIKRAVEIFGRCDIIVAVNPEKHAAFNIVERVDLVRASLEEEGILTWYAPVCSLTSGFVADECDANEEFLVRGIRKGSEVEFERQVADFNRDRTGIETVWLPAQPELSEVSSTMLKVMVEQGLDVSKYCTKAVLKALQDKVGK